MVLSNEMTSQSSNNGQVDADENESITEYRSKFQTNFEILDHLGEGGYGIVFKVRDRNDGKEYAVKRIELPKHSGWQLIEREIRIRDCDHPNIVKYFDSWIEQPPQEWQENEDLKWREAFNLLSISSGSASNESEILSTQSSSAYLYIQMELCEGDLAEWLLNTDRHVRENRIGSIFKQIIAAVKYIHGKKLIHRDLKVSEQFFYQFQQSYTSIHNYFICALFQPANILIGSEGVIKIGDFGTTVEHDCRNTQKKHSACPKSHTEGIGTGWYIAPEVERGYYSYSADIFSLGVILFELINPFRTAIERNAVLDALRNTAFPKDFDDQYKPEVNIKNIFMNQKFH